MQQVASLPDAAPRPRLDFVDVAKGIGIILVVLGHIPGLWPEWLRPVIYSFHMPLFFFLSGLLSGDGRSMRSRSFVRHFSSRLVPYLTFGALTLVLTLSLRYGKWGVIEPEQIQQGLGSLLIGKPIRGIELWFYPCLLIVELLGVALLRAKSVRIQFLSCAVLASIGFILAPWNSVIPFSFDVALVALPFWFVGVAMTAHSSRLEGIIRPLHWFVAVPAAAGLIYFKVFVISSGVDMRTGSYGSAALFYVTAAVGIIVTLLLSALFRHNRLLIFLGKASFVIYPFHGVIIMLVTLVALHFGWGIQHSREAFNLLRFICAILGTCAVYLVVIRHSSLLFFFTGRRSSRPVIAKVYERRRSCLTCLPED